MSSGRKPAMIVIGGMSGSGKSTLGEELARRMPNAVFLDSDVVRKQLFGVDPTTPLPEQAYTAESTKKFIRHIHRKASKHLQKGKTVIVTGLFLDTQTREKQEKLAKKNDADFVGIYMHASAALLFDRVAKRTGSASDADKKVLRRQFKTIPPRPFHELNWHIINADQSLDNIVSSAAYHIRRKTSKSRVSAFSPQKSQKKQKPAPSGPG